MVLEAVCSVCYSTLGLDNRIASMPCGHTFHEDCLSDWLHQVNSNSTCPYCTYTLKQDQQPITLIFGTEADLSSESKHSLNTIKKNLKQFEQHQAMVKEIEPELTNIIDDNAVFAGKQMAYGVLQQIDSAKRSDENAREVDVTQTDVTKLQMGYEICKQANSIRKYTNPEIVFAIVGFITLCLASIFDGPLKRDYCLILGATSIGSFAFMHIHMALTVCWTKYLIPPSYEASFSEVQKILFPKSYGYSVLLVGTVFVSIGVHFLSAVPALLIVAFSPLVIYGIISDND